MAFKALGLLNELPVYWTFVNDFFNPWLRELTINTQANKNRKSFLLAQE